MKSLKNWTGQSFFKQQNNVILQSIWDLIDTKELVFNLYKVKGHSRYLWNDMVDLMVKTGESLARDNRNRIVDIKYLDLYRDSSSFLPTWNNMEIDRNVRRFTTMVSDVLKEV